MRVLQLGATNSAALVLIGLAYLAQGATKPKANANPDSRSEEAAELVHQALAAEADGQPERRATYLARAVEVAPDYALAHWQLGEVRQGDHWLSIDDASAETTRLGKVDQYRQLRKQTKNTAGEQMKLAHWCADAGLKGQERVHLAAALQRRPTSAQTREIISKLDLVRYRNTYMTAEEAERLRGQAKQSEAAFREWKPRIARLRGDLESRDKARQASAERQLATIDVAAVPALEAVFANSTPADGKTAITALASIREPPATDSLIRHAIFAEHEEVRTAAAQALRSRDIFGYAPLLLSEMNSPIEVQFQVSTLGGGAAGERLSLYRGGPLYDQSYVSRTVVVPQPGASRASSNGAGALVQESSDALRDARLAVAAIEENARTDFMNRRIADTLRVATGNEGFGTDPKRWWDWWTDYNETHYSSEKPVYKFVRDSVIPAFRPSNSCFVAGTKVWTDTGTVPIENVQIGDWVLSKNVDTGELVYMPVSATTHGPPLPLMEIRAGNETIRCTHGHLFWVSGIGWKMAKELHSGQWLHTARGPVLIDNVEKKGEASCHNLIVPDFNTYFVTDQQILVHDINIRGPTLATVPGLINP